MEKEDLETTVDKKGFLKELVSWIIIIIGCFIATKIITTFIIINGFVPSSSMENTVMTGDRFMGNRLAYVFSEPERFDVIVFPAPDEPEKLLIKRIIGIPGDSVEIIDGELYINGEIEVESYLKEDMKGSFGPYDVPTDMYLTLGDNRNYSIDSRYWDNTYVDINTILGEAVFTYYPKIHLIK